MTIEPGDYVKCKITGFEGIAVMVVTWQYNCNRVKIQPQQLTAEGCIKETETIDSTQLEVIAKKSINLDVPFETKKFDYGDIVKDKLSGFKGAVYGFSLHINGCRRVAVMCCEMKDNQPIDEVWFPQEQIEIIEAKKEATHKKTGGPMKEIKERKMPYEKGL